MLESEAKTPSLDLALINYWSFYRAKTIPKLQITIKTVKRYRPIVSLLEAGSSHFVQFISEGSGALII